MSTQESTSISNTGISKELMQLLCIIKGGVRDVRTIAMRLAVDDKYAKELTAYAQRLGLVTSRTRLTPYGADQMFKASGGSRLSEWDYSLYIPTSWCVDRNG